MTWLTYGISDIAPSRPPLTENQRRFLWASGKKDFWLNRFLDFTTDYTAEVELAAEIERYGCIQARPFQNIEHQPGGDPELAMPAHLGLDDAASGGMRHIEWGAIGEVSTPEYVKPKAMRPLPVEHPSLNLEPEKAIKRMEEDAWRAPAQLRTSKQYKPPLLCTNCGRSLKAGRDSIEFCLQCLHEEPHLLRLMPMNTPGELGASWRYLWEHLNNFSPQGIIEAVRKMIAKAESFRADSPIDIAQARQALRVFEGYE